jgi:hypothetical protein
MLFQHLWVAGNIIQKITNWPFGINESFCQLMQLQERDGLLELPFSPASVLWREAVMCGSQTTFVSVPPIWGELLKGQNF